MTEHAVSTATFRDDSPAFAFTPAAAVAGDQPEAELFRLAAEYHAAQNAQDEISRICDASGPGHCPLRRGETCLCDDAGAVCVDAAHAVLAVRASTFAGLLCKLRVGRRYGIFEGALEVSLFADLDTITAA